MKLRGTVSWFDPKLGYGFLSGSDASGGKDIFLHRSNGRFFQAGERIPEWGKDRLISGVQVFKLADPEAGEPIVFELVRSEKGWIANPWGHEADFDQVREILNRFEVRVLQLRLQRTDRRKRDPQPEILWQGEIDGLIKQFAVKRGQSDPLQLLQIEGRMEVWTWIECRGYGQPWHRLHDPRPSDLSQLVAV